MDQENWKNVAKLQSVDQSSLNVLINGKSGSGKTWLACSLAEGIKARLEAKMKEQNQMQPIRVVHFDREDGAKARIPEGRECWHMLKGVQANLQNFLYWIPQILQDPEVKIIIADNLTTIWNDAKEMQKEYMLEKARKNQWTERKVEMYKEDRFTMMDWPAIKKKYYALVKQIIDSDKHFIAISRAGDEYDMDDPNQPKRTGGLTVKAEGETKFEFDVFVEMALQENITSPDQKGVKDVYWAKCTKDRWDMINGSVVKNPDSSWILPIFDKLAKTHRIQTQPEMKPTADVVKAHEENESMGWINTMMKDDRVLAGFKAYEEALGKPITEQMRIAALGKYLNNIEGFFSSIEKNIGETNKKKSKKS